MRPVMFGILILTSSIGIALAQLNLNTNYDMISPGNVSSQRLEIDAALVSYFNPELTGMGSIPYTGALFDMAVEDVNRKYNNSMQINLRKIYEKNARACAELEYNAERLVAKCLAITRKVEKREDYPTFITNSFYPADEFRDFFVETQELFNWTSIYIITDLKGLSVWKVAGSNFYNTYKNAGPKKQAKVKEINSTLEVQYDRLLREIANASRTVFYFGDASGLRTFMVYFALEAVKDAPNQNGIYHWFSAKDSNENNELAKMAFRSLFVFSSLEGLGNRSNQFKDIAEEMKYRSLRDYNLTYNYDGSYLVLNPAYSMISALGEVFHDLSGDRSNDLHDGTLVANHFLNRTFNTNVGSVYINPMGVRQIDLILSTFNQHGEKVVFIKKTGSTLKNTIFMEELQWPGEQWPPANEPLCGYDGQKLICQQNGSTSYSMYYVIGGCCISVLAIILLMLIKRMQKLEEQKYSRWWNVHVGDLYRFRLTQSKANLGGAFGSTMSVSIVSARTRQDVLDNCAANTAVFQGHTVYLLPNSNILMTNSVEHELKKIRHIKCDNLVRVIGVCLSEGFRALIFEYCPRGDIYDLVQNHESYTFIMDWNLRLSLICDIVQGLHFIHHSWLRGHGKLRSTKCLIDKHFAVKITDYVLRNLRPTPNEEHVAQNVHWIAPEMMERRNETLEHISGLEIRRADIYSLGIIMSEIKWLRDPQKPAENQSKEEIMVFLGSVSNGDQVLPEEKTISATSLIAQCLLSDAVSRPDIDCVDSALQSIAGNVATGALDNLIARQSAYADELDNIVHERTAHLHEERKKTEALLFEILPRSIARKLISGMMPDPEEFDEVTILFSCVEQFGDIILANSPLDVILILNELYHLIDMEISNFDAYKVETIADTYMVVSGLPVVNGIRHVAEIAHFTLHLLELMKTFRIEWIPTLKVQLKIGFHTGKCMAGIIGQKMPRYCLFGDTVNTANRMESTSEGGKIQVSETSKELLRQTDLCSFTLEPRGKVFVKNEEEYCLDCVMESQIHTFEHVEMFQGKGDMETYWLVAVLENRQTKPTT